jgi:hypothetical protein
MYILRIVEILFKLRWLGPHSDLPDPRFRCFATALGWMRHRALLLIGGEEKILPLSRREPQSIPQPVTTASVWTKQAILLYDIPKWTNRLK